MFMYKVPLKFYAAYPGTKMKREFEKLKQGVDVLVITPDRFERHRSYDKLHLSMCETLIIDELDTLLDSGYQEYIESLIKPLVVPINENDRKRKASKQVVFWWATITKPVESLLSNFWEPEDPNFAKCIDKNTHMNLSNLDHEFIHLCEQDKYRPLEIILREFRKFKNKSNTSCMVFVNSIQSARAAEHKISELGFRVSSLHGDIPPLLRKKYMNDFKLK